MTTTATLSIKMTYVPMFDVESIDEELSANLSRSLSCWRNVSRPITAG